MKKRLDWTTAVPEKEIPMELDNRILLAASLQAAKLKRARRARIVIPSAAAAVLAVAVTGFAFLTADQSAAPVRPEICSGVELLALGDWTSFEQESYAVNSSCEEFQELSRNFEDSLI